MKQFLLICFCFVVFHLSAQSHEYIIRISGVEDVATAKAVSSDMSKIFDLAPAYSGTAHEFRVKSATDIHGETFASKLEAMGYVVVFFKRDGSIEINE